MQNKMMQEGQSFYDVWMYQVSDEIQSLAIAFGNRYMLQGALQYLADCADPKANLVLKDTIRLHMLSLVREDLSWYLINEMISDQAAANFDNEFD